MNTEKQEVPEFYSLSPENSLSKYIVEMAKTQLLTREEELKLTTMYITSCENFLKAACDTNLLMESIKAIEGILTTGKIPTWVERSAFSNRGRYLQNLAKLLIQAKKFKNKASPEQIYTIVHGLCPLHNWVAQYANNTPKVKKLKRIVDDIKNRLIASNLRLVVCIAKRYQNRGVLLLDLIQEGNLGLIYAIERYRPENGVKLATYASWWIRQGVLRAIEREGRFIRIPEYSRITAAKKQLQSKLHREPTIEELNVSTGISIEKIEDILEAIDTRILSLNVPVGPDTNATLAEFIPDEHTENPAVKAETTILKDKVGTLLDALTARERLVVCSRFGLMNHPIRTLQEISDELHVTRERIRQIEFKALKKMRHPGRLKFLDQDEPVFFTGVERRKVS